MKMRTAVVWPHTKVLEALAEHEWLRRHYYVGSMLVSWMLALGVLWVLFVLTPFLDSLELGGTPLMQAFVFACMMALFLLAAFLLFFGWVYIGDLLRTYMRADEK